MINAHLSYTLLCFAHGWKCDDCDGSMAISMIATRACSTKAVGVGLANDRTPPREVLVLSPSVPLTHIS